MGLYSVMEERRLVVDYSRVFGLDTWTVLMKNDGLVNITSDSLLLPFDVQVSV